MALNRKVSALTGGVTDKQAERAVYALKARKSAAVTWDDIADELGVKFDRAYLWQVAMGDRPPSRRLLLALGIVKPEKRNDIRIRMTLSDAREIVEHDTMPVNVKNRIRYAMWGKK